MGGSLTIQGTSTSGLKRQPCHVHQIVVEAAIEDQAKHGLEPHATAKMEASDFLLKSKPFPIPSIYGYTFTYMKGSCLWHMTTWYTYIMYMCIYLYVCVFWYDVNICNMYEQVLKIFHTWILWIFQAKNDSYQLWRRTGCLWQGAIVSCTSSCVDRHLGESNGKNLGRVGKSSCRKLGRKSDETDKWTTFTKIEPTKNAKKSPMPTHFYTLED